MRLTGWPLIALLYCFGLLSTSCVGKMFPIIGVIAGEFGVRTTLAAWLISCVVVLAIVGLPIVGSLIARVGARHMLALGALIGVLANLGAMACHGFLSLLLARLVEGVSFSLIMVAGTTLMAGAHAGPRQAAAMSVWATAGPAGVGISQALSGLAANSAWRHVFAWSATACAVAALLTALVPDLPRSEPKPGARSAGLFSSYTSVPLLKLCATCMLATVAGLAIASVFPTYLHEQLGSAIAEASSIGAVASAGTIAGSLLGSWLLARSVSPVRLTLWALAPLAAFGALVFLPRLGPVGIAAALILNSAALGVASGSVAAVLPQAVPGPAALGPAIGMYYQFANVGMLLAAPLAFVVYV
ncbi:MAG TPA: MFS transporter, partial [Steroidobacteraceae bacterium]|nr:MFS transporter [Steroidobacteraceae bacterium]